MASVDRARRYISRLHPRMGLVVFDERDATADVAPDQWGLPPDVGVRVLRVDEITPRLEHQPADGRYWRWGYASDHFLCYRAILRRPHWPMAFAAMIPLTTDFEADVGDSLPAFLRNSFAPLAERALRTGG